MWPSFLTTACHNFRLSFDKQVLLYAQRPDATAVLPIEGKHGWNQKFGRWVNRGSKGIALFDSDRNGVATLKYYFDISDTHEGRYPRPVPIWSVRPEFEQDILETLENSFGDLEKKDSLASGLISAAQNVVEDNISDYLEQIMYYREGSFLDPLDDESIAAIFKPLLQNSVGYMLLIRCGIDPSAYYQKDDFGYISGFNTLQTINTLGTATSDISQILLRMKAEQTQNRKLCGSCYCQEYLDYIYVNEIGELIKPGYLTSHVPAVLKKNNMPKLRFHDLRHPYVKHTTKKFSCKSRNPKPSNILRWSGIPAFSITEGADSQSNRSWTLYAISMRLPGNT